MAGARNRFKALILVAASLLAACASDDRRPADVTAAFAHLNAILREADRQPTPLAKYDVYRRHMDDSPALRPMYQLDAMRMLEQDEVLLEAAAQPNGPAAAAVLARGAARKPLPGPPPSVGAAWFGGAAAPPKRVPIDYARVLSSNLLGGSGMGRAIQQDMRLRSERGMSAVSLAAQVYRADHGGAWPASIEPMVPRYLPRVPRDAMAAGNPPLGYVLVKGGLPDGSDRPLVYSVGTNGVDDTANGATPPPTPCYDWQNNRDEWRDLTRWTPYLGTTRPATAPTAAPASAPSSQAADDQPDKADDPRKDC